MGIASSVHVDELPSQSRSPMAYAVALVAPPTYVYWYWLGSAIWNSRSFQPASAWNTDGCGTHLSFEPPPPPPQQLAPGPAPLAGSRAPFCVKKLKVDWNSVFRFLPILFRFSEASLDFDFFMYSMKAGIATAARMPMIATTIMSSMS